MAIVGRAETHLEGNHRFILSSLRDKWTRARDSIETTKNLKVQVQKLQGKPIAPRGKIRLVDFTRETTDVNPEEARNVQLKHTVK